MFNYIVAYNGNKKYENIDREKAFLFIKNNFKIFNDKYLYEPLGVGCLECWKKNKNRVEIIRVKIYKFDIKNFIKNFIKKDTNFHTIDINYQNKTPLSPRRTTITNKNKKEKASEGKILIDEKGIKWICKKNNKGQYKWNQFHQNDYSVSSITKRKCPKKPAKNFEEGDLKKGLDGNIWIVKITNNGIKKWFKK